MPLFFPFHGIRPCAKKGDSILSFCRESFPALTPEKLPEWIQDGRCAIDTEEGLYLYEETLLSEEILFPGDVPFSEETGKGCNPGEEEEEKNILGFFALTDRPGSDTPFGARIFFPPDETGETVARLRALSHGPPRYEETIGSRRYRLWLINDPVILPVLCGDDIAPPPPPGAPKNLCLVFPKGQPDFPLSPLWGMVFFQNP